MGTGSGSCRAAACLDGPGNVMAALLELGSRKATCSGTSPASNSEGPFVLEAPECRRHPRSPAVIGQANDLP
jgi:hypothetical protein